MSGGPLLAVAFDAAGARPAWASSPAATGPTADPGVPVAVVAWAVGSKDHQGGAGAGGAPVVGPVDVLVPEAAGDRPGVGFDGTAVVAAELRRCGLAVGCLGADPWSAAVGRTLGAALGALGHRPKVALALPGAGTGWMAADGHGPGPDDRPGAARVWTTVPGPVRRSLERWATATAGRRVVLAAPRSFCAGVERAVDIVERSLERFGPPVYVRRQIVHNRHVVHGLQERGAVFVQELDEVPEGATVVLAAHGVAPVVRRQADDRHLRVIDATCPLVAKVHREARGFVAGGRRIVLVGHTDHEEVAGTVGEAPDHVHVVADAADVARLPLADDAPVAYLTQTTLAIDETAAVVGALRRRFADLVGPAADDICYATQNRQDAVRALAATCDVVLVVGSANSSNTARLVEVARRQGRPAHLIEDASELELSWLEGVGSVGVTAGASAPESLVRGVVDALGALGPVSVTEHRTTEERVRFSLPPQVR